jgi:WD40 repeat protein
MGRLAFSPDGRFLLVPVGPIVELYVAASGKRIAAMEGDPVVVSGAAVSPDGTKLVSIGETGRLVVWDMSALNAYSCSGFTISKVDWAKGCITIKNTTSGPGEPMLPARLSTIPASQVGVWS